MANHSILCVWCGVVWGGGGVRGGGLAAQVKPALLNILVMRGDHIELSNCAQRSTVRGIC